jgi:hypothetical protein
MSLSIENACTTLRSIAARVSALALASGAGICLVACGAGAGGNDVTRSTSEGVESPDTCENFPNDCTAVVVSASPTSAGFIFVQCASTGNGEYTVGLSTSGIEGPFTLDPSATTTIDGTFAISDIDEANEYFPGCNRSTGVGCVILANTVQVCATNQNPCPIEGNFPQCLALPLTYEQQSSSGSGSGSGSSSGTTSGSSSGTTSGSSSGSSGGGLKGGGPGSGGKCGKLAC